MNKRLILIAGVVMAVAAGIWYFLPTTQEDVSFYAEVKKGEFVVKVSTTGELEAQNFVRIIAPEGLRQARLYNVKISELIPEGTVVDSGDVVAKLDRSSIADKISDAASELSKAQSKFTQTRLDTALELRQARDNLKDLLFAIEEKKIVVEQSAYEPPATQKQARIELEKAHRNYEQTKTNYELKRQQAVAKMQEANETLKQEQRKFEFLQELSTKFVIHAPEPGMLTYVREWGGNKRRAGSQISPWDATVATLPDLKVMNSRTYVNEVDIRKIKSGQQVNIGFDAYPDKKLSGVVTEVANVGEQRPNTDAKVFEVMIKVNETDTTLRPGMTTSNLILADVIPDATYIPLEAVQIQGDSISYVIVKEGMTFFRRKVNLGKTNENEVIVENGLSEGQIVLLSIPESPENIAFK